MAETRDAHFLHARGPLEAVLSPPIDNPGALCWLGDTDRLLVASNDGDLVEVDPVFGTRTLAGELVEPAELAANPDGSRVVVAERNRRLGLYDCRNGQRLAELPLPLFADLSACWFVTPTHRTGVAVCGDGLEGRWCIVADEDFSTRRRLRLPPQTAVGRSAEGRLICARSTQSGLEVLPLGKPLGERTLSPHRLRFGTNGAVLGITEGGVTVWRASDREPWTQPMHDVTAAALSPDGGLLALGTRSGEVAVAQVGGGRLERVKPGKVGGHDEAVRQLAFANKGRWLATLAGRIRLWRW